MREWLYGRQAVRETLRAKRRNGFLLRMADGAQDRAILQEILELARKRKIPMERVNRDALDPLGDGHQGVALQVDEYPAVNLEDILAHAADGGRPPLLLLLDQIQDPQNLGTLLRTAEAAAVDGVVLPTHRAAGVTPAVVNASAGAVEHLLVAQANLAQAIETIKQHGIWVAGLEATPEAQPLFEADLSGPLALVVGSEGEGLRPLVRKSCDFLFSLPMLGRVGSLNAAVAGSIALYAVLRARGGEGKI
jgi:23S rRNA (guanosine2251-2'-O)-methyltransferase